MGNHLVVRRERLELAKIENQPLDPVNQSVVDATAGFAGRKKDAPLDLRIEDNLLKAARRYATLRRKAAKRAEKAGKTVEFKLGRELMTRGKHLRNRMIDLAKKINMGKPGRIFFKLDADADPDTANLLRLLLTREAMEEAFKAQRRGAPEEFWTDFEIVFFGHRRLPEEKTETTSPTAQPAA